MYLQSEFAYGLQYPQPSPNVSLLEHVAMPVKSDEHPSLVVLQNSLKSVVHCPWAIPQPSSFPQLKGSDYLWFILYHPVDSSKLKVNSVKTESGNSEPVMASLPKATLSQWLPAVPAPPWFSNGAPQADEQPKWLFTALTTFGKIIQSLPPYVLTILLTPIFYIVFGSI